MIPDVASKLSYHFLVGFFMPAAALTAAATYASGWAPHTHSTSGDALDVTTSAGAVFLMSAAQAVLLEALNFILIRVFEGASGWPAPAAERGRHRWVARLRRMTKRIDALKAKNTEASFNEAYRLEQQRFVQFPSREEDVLPTELGNVIAAWEHYPYRRYGMDAIVLWPRLAPLLSKPVSDAIVSAKARFDLMFNALILLPVWGLLRATVVAQPGEGWGRAWWLLIGLAATVPLWRLCISAAMGWGNTVKAAFDLHRLDMLKPLGVADLPASWSAKEERELWREVQWPMKFDHEPSLRAASRREASKDPGARGGDPGRS